VVESGVRETECVCVCGGGTMRRGSSHIITKTHVPPLTVASFAARATRRPAMRPRPVTTPPAGTSSSPGEEWMDGWRWMDDELEGRGARTR
jgi:hypothetical protein